MALFAIIGPARTWGKRPLIMPDFVAGPIEFQQLSVVRTAFARPRMDLRTEERAGASGPVLAIRSKRFFEGAQTGRRARCSVVRPAFAHGIRMSKNQKERAGVHTKARRH